MYDELIELLGEDRSILSIKNRIKKEYENIYDACIAENFFDSLAKHYDFFKWIEIREGTIGFMLFTFHNTFYYNDLLMETYYILPEFRNKFDLLYELEDVRVQSEEIYLNNPKRDDIEALIAEKYCHYINDRSYLLRF